MRPSLFIGLGGTGVSAILKTKALLLDTYGQNGALPPCFSFLGIDTDQQAFSQSVMSKTAGEVSLSVFEQAAAHVHDAQAYYRHHRDDMTWIPEQNQNYLIHGDLIHGAGAVRTNGRLAFIYNLRNIESYLQHNIESYLHHPLLNLARPGCGIDVHIAFSLCGGTGSGMFLDLAYLLRELSSQFNIPIFLNGYGVMPGVFEHQVRSAHLACDRWRANTYAALHELDYLMSLPTDAGRGVQMPWMNHESCERPFDYFSLVDNVNAHGYVLRSLTEVVDVLSYQLVQDVICDPISSEYKARLKMKAPYYDVCGKHAWVSSLGVSAITYNAEYAAQFYGLKMQNYLIDQLLNDSADIEVMRLPRFCISWGAGRNQVLDALYEMQPSVSFRVPATIRRRQFKEEIKEEMERYSAYMLSTEEWNMRVERLYEDTISSLKGAEEQSCRESLGAVFALLEEVKRQIQDVLLPEMYKQSSDWKQRTQMHNERLELTMDEAEEYLGRVFFPSRKERYIDSICEEFNLCIRAKFEVQCHAEAISFYQRLLPYLYGELERLVRIKDVFLSIHNENTNRMCEMLNCRDMSMVEINLAEHVIRENNNVSYSDFSVRDFLSVFSIYTLSGSESIDTYRTALNNYVSNTSANASWRDMTLVDILDAMSQGALKYVEKCAMDQSVPWLRIDAFRVFPVGNGTWENFYISISMPESGLLRLKDIGFYHDIVRRENAIPMSTELQDCIIVYRLKLPVIASLVAETQRMGDACARVFSAYSAYVDENLRKRMDEEAYSLFPKIMEQDDSEEL